MTDPEGWHIRREAPGQPLRVDGSHRALRDGDHLTTEMAYAEKARIHLWAAMVVYKVPADALVTGVDVLFDPENMLSVQVGCLVCERAYEPRLLRRACKGQPPGELRYVGPGGTVIE